MITKAGRHPRFLKTTLNPPSDCSSLLDIPPPNNLELEFIHGCSKKGCNGNIFHMNTSGELVYPAAACGVVYNYENNSQKIFIRHTDDVTCVAKHPNGDIFATGNLGKNNMVCVWNSHYPAEPVAVLDSHIFFKQGGVYALAFSNDGTKLAAVGGAQLDNMLLVYDWQSATLLGHCKAHNDEVFDLSFSPDDSKILLGGKNTAKFFEINDGLKAKQAIFSPRGTAQSSYSSCYDLLGNPICGMKDGSLYCFYSNKLVFKKQAHSGAVYCIYRTGNGFITSGRDGKIIWWQFTDEKIEGVNMFKDIASINLLDQVRSVVPSTVEEDVIFASRTNGDLVKIYNKTKVELVLVSHFGDQKTELWGLCTIPGTPLFVSGGDDGRLILWNTETRKHVQQIKVSTKGDLRSVAYSNGHIATGTKYGTLFVYNFNGDSISPQPVVNTRDAKEEIAALQYSPDGSLLAAGSHDNNIYIYETKSYRLVMKLTGHTSFVKSIDFTSDCSMIRSTSGDYEVLLWNTAQGKQLTHDGHLEDFDWATVNCTVAWKVRGVWKPEMDGTDVNAVDVQFGRQLLASAGDNGRVTLFHYPTAIATPQRVEYLGHCSHVTNVKFTNDGKYLLSAGGGDVTVMQWRIQ